MSVQRTMILVWALAFLALALFAVLYQYVHNPATSDVSFSQTEIRIGSTVLQVEVADTPAARTQGLSGRAPLVEGEGLLFVFDEAREHGIWMKDMRFAIDIVWADSNGTILTIKKNVSPDTYPEVFYPAGPALYVLELPAGFVERRGIATGDKIVVQ